MLFLIRRFLESDNALAQWSKAVIGTASGAVAYFHKAVLGVSPVWTETGEYARIIGGVAAAFCSVAMAVGMVIGWIKWLRRWWQAWTGASEE